MMPLLNLTPDQLLATTRSVRKRLDFSQPLDPVVIRECLELAVQAPTGGNRQGWQFVVITDPAKRRALGDIYRQGWAYYRGLPINQPKAITTLQMRDPARAQTLERILESSNYLAEHIHEAPGLVIPCIRGRPESLSACDQAGFWGSIMPAAWSFMLAARARGLGTAWTSVHLYFEREAADLLGIPFERVTQAALIPVAYSRGTDFKPAAREPLEMVTHWDQW
jgi:nitroreductase